MNLSIFSFDTINALFAAPIKTKAWCVCLVLGFCSCLVLCSAILASFFPDKAPEEMKLPSPDTRILLLGNSQFVGLNVFTPDWPLVNASLDGSDFVIQEAILHAHASPKLRVLLLGFDNIPLHVTGMADRKGDYRDIVSRGVSWYAIPGLSLLKSAEFKISYLSILKPLLVGPKLDVDYFKTLHYPAAQAVTLPEMKTPTDFDPNRVNPPFFAPPSGGEKKMKKYLEIYAKRDHFSENRDAFLRIIKFCSGHGIVPILLRSPTVETFRNARIPEWDKELKQLYQEALKLNKGNKILIWDDDQSEIFPIYLFDDPNHLNGEGKLRYSEALVIRLKDLASQIKWEH